MTMVFSFCMEMGLSKLYRSLSGSVLVNGICLKHDDFIYIFKCICKDLSHSSDFSCFSIISLFHVFVLSLFVPLNFCWSFVSRFCSIS